MGSIKIHCDIKALELIDCIGNTSFIGILGRSVSAVGVAAICSEIRERVRLNH
jgi:hypothetical protein